MRMAQGGFRSGKVWRAMTAAVDQHKQKGAAMGRNTVGVLAIALAAGLMVIAGATPASAEFINPSVITLSDRNSSAQIDLGDQRGMYNWTIDGVNHLNQQWFWYRVGNTGGEQPINALTLDSYSLSEAGNSLDVTYTGAAAGTTFAVDVNYLLTGGAVGSRWSDIAETIRIRNTGQASLDFHFFQYSDFDLMGTAGNDTVEIGDFGSVLVARQTDGMVALSETSALALRVPNFCEVGVYGATLAKLNDGLPTELDNSVGPLGPDNVTWAFQWDKTLGQAGSNTDTLLISKDKQVQVDTQAPEPMTISLLAAGGAVMLLGRRYRRVATSR